MGQILSAWLVAEGLVISRGFISRNKKIPSEAQASNNKAYPPSPRDIALVTALFAALAFLAESEKTRTIAILLAWGLDAATFLSMSTAVWTKVGGWPPPTTPNNVVFPTSSSSSATAVSSSTASVPPTTPPGTLNA